MCILCAYTYMLTYIYTQLHMMTVLLQAMKHAYMRAYTYVLTYVYTHLHMMTGLLLCFSMRLDDAKRVDMKGGYFAVTLVGYCIGLTICEVSISRTLSYDILYNGHLFHTSLPCPQQSCSYLLSCGDLVFFDRRFVVWILSWLYMSP